MCNNLINLLIMYTLQRVMLNRYFLIMEKSFQLKKCYFVKFYYVFIVFLQPTSPLYEI